MALSARGWDHGSRAKPGAEIEIRFGSELLKRESGDWPRYGIVTTASAIEAARPSLARDPEGVVYADWLDSQHQRDLAEQLPDDIELVVGLGGGRALDNSKYAAIYKDKPLILVPTIVSTGAIVRGQVAKWDGRKLIGDQDDWPWIDCNHVLIDYETVLAAPYYLNTAGIGDILCTGAGLVEADWKVQQGTAEPVDEAIVAGLEAYYDGLVDGFVLTLGVKGELTADSVKHIMTSLQQRDSQEMQTRSGDHPFWLALELINDRAWIHGELVALGSVMIAWQTGIGLEKLTDRMSKCKVRIRPSEIGLSREELKKGLEFTPQFMAQRDIDSILRHKPIVGERFDELWSYLQTL